MWSQIIKTFKYILAILGIYKLINLCRNIFGLPFFYDIFLCDNNTKVCLIAPDYTLVAFKKISCLFLINNQIIWKKADIISDSESDCIVVTFPLPEESLNEANVRIKLSKGKKIFYEKSFDRLIDKNRFQLSITTLFKYELSFLKEWIEYYLKEGVEHFYLYDNNDIKDNRALVILKEYIDKGLVTYIRWPYSYVIYNFRIKNFWPNDAYNFTQSAQINHTLYKYGNQTKWLLYCDLDEYFYSMKNNVLKDQIKLINLSAGVSSLIVSGKWFGGRESDLQNLSNFGVVKTFIYSEEGFNSPPKCFFYMDNIILASVHKVVIKKKGEDIEVPSDIIRFNHYRAMGWKRRLDPGFATQVENRDILNLV